VGAQVELELPPDDCAEGLDLVGQRRGQVERQDQPGLLRAAQQHGALPARLGGAAQQRHQREQRSDAEADLARGSRSRDGA
jgi:hypothetical protein